MTSSCIYLVSQKSSHSSDSWLESVSINKQINFMTELPSRYARRDSQLSHQWAKDRQEWMALGQFDLPVEVLW